MATKDQKIKSLELENIDLGEKLNGVSEIAGDLFIGLALAADMIQEQQAMLEIDALVLSIADEVIGQQKNEINRMQRAESRRQSQEEEEKRNKAKLAEVRNMPSLVDWALVNVEATANGMDFTAKPDRWGRKRVTTTDINSDGSNGVTVATTKGKANLRFTVPVFGSFEVNAKITHTETGSDPQSAFVTIQNTLVFKFKMGGKKYRVTITAGGDVRRGCGDWYADTHRSTTTVDYWCDSCETWHYQDDFRTGVKTSPVNTERRSSGCGGY